MSAYSNFEKSVQKSMDWLSELENIDGILNKEEAYSILRATFHTLRDRLTVEEIAHLASQLPMTLRGLLYESWKPSETPVKYNKEEFIQKFEKRCEVGNADFDSEAAISAALYVIEKNISKGEIRHIKSMLPEDLLILWPEQKAA